MFFYKTFSDKVDKNGLSMGQEMAAVLVGHLLLPKTNNICDGKFFG
jgi:hypothetical protein